MKARTHTHTSVLKKNELAGTVLELFLKCQTITIGHSLTSCEMSLAPSSANKSFFFSLSRYCDNEAKIKWIHNRNSCSTFWCFRRPLLLLSNNMSIDCSIKGFYNRICSHSSDGKNFGCLSVFFSLFGNTIFVYV